MNRLLKRFLLAPVFLPLLLPGGAVGDDWPQWRGANRDGICKETGLLDSWPESGPPRVWTAGGLGGGYASPSIVAGKIFGTGYVGGEEVVWALSVEDGKEVWRTAFAKVDVAYGEIEYSEGPRATPTIDGDRLFVLGAAGHLSCLETGTGKMVWTKSLAEDFGGEVMSDWGFSEAPLIDGDHVICTPGGAMGTVAALDKKSGEMVWQSKDLQDPAAYTSLVAAELGGKKQYVVLTGASVAGIDPENGEVLWKSERKGKTAVVPTPIVEKDNVWVTSGYGVGSHLFHVDNSGGKFAAELVYDSRKLKNEFGGAIKVGDHVYGSSGVTFVCMDFETGDVAWRERTIGSGGLLYADGHFYLRNDRGKLALIEASPDAYVEKSRFEQGERSEGKSWPTPVISDGRLYLRDQDALICYDIKKK